MKKGDWVRCNICNVEKEVSSIGMSETGALYQVITFKDGSVCPLVKECVVIGRPGNEKGSEKKKNTK